MGEIFTATIIEQLHRIILFDPHDLEQIMGVATVEPDFGAVGKLDIDIEARGALRGVGGCGWHLVDITVRPELVEGRFAVIGKWASTGSARTDRAIP